MYVRGCTVIFIQNVHSWRHLQTHTHTHTCIHFNKDILAWNYRLKSHDIPRKVGWPNVFQMQLPGEIKTSWCVKSQISSLRFIFKIILTLYHDSRSSPFPPYGLNLAQGYAQWLKNREREKPLPISLKESLFLKHTMQYPVCISNKLHNMFVYIAERKKNRKVKMGLIVR